MVLELTEPDLSWVDAEAADRVQAVVGSAADDTVAATAADRAESMAPLAGWVNNAAVFEDADLADDPGRVLHLVTANLGPAVVGSADDHPHHWRARERGGAIVNVSSHQAQRAVRGALPYATAKAAVEGLTRALAVDAGPEGIRVNAVALGSIATARYDALLDQAGPTSPPGSGPRCAAAPARQGRHGDGGGRGGGVPAVAGRVVRQRCGDPGRRRSLGPRAGPQAT